MLAQDASDELAVAGVADDEWRVEHRGAKAGRKIVQHDGVCAQLAQLPNDVAADVSGAAGNENGHG